MKFGMVGTGYWARVTHGVGLARHENVDLVAIWGRDSAKALALGDKFHAKAYTDFGEFLGQVDAVTFAVPPEIQAELATQAAGAGKHLLLEKPLATSVAGAQQLAEAAERSGVCSVVLFTGLFTQANRDWLSQLRESGGWEGAWARWIVAAFAPDSPYASSPWRREKGGLRDVGHHALGMLTAALGPVDHVTADGGRVTWSI